MLLLVHAAISTGAAFLTYRGVAESGLSPMWAALLALLVFGSYWAGILHFVGIDQLPECPR